MIYNIFYDNDKNIVWSTTGLINDAIKSAQAGLGNSHVALESENIPDGNFYVNSDATALVEKSIFNCVFSTTNPALDEVVNVTGVPAGTEVFKDGESIGTMTDTTLTLTTQEPGQYIIKFKKLHYKQHSGTTVTVKRYGQ
jgi:hypothetical protein